jgi:hypothetical protein
MRSAADVERFLQLTVLGAIPASDGTASPRGERRPAKAPRPAEAAR